MKNCEIQTIHPKAVPATNVMPKSANISAIKNG